jgi:DNA-binding IclR family transcriptional regulator
MRNALPGARPSLAAALAAAKRPRRRRGAARARGVPSFEKGLAVFEALASARRPLALGVIAARAGLKPPHAHRYLASLARRGLVVQDSAGGDYRLGPEAAVLATRALASIGPVRIALEALPAIAAELDESVGVAVWGTAGATILAIEESTHPVTMNVRAGTVAPLADSATGRVFAAHLNDTVVAAAWRRERPRARAAERAAAEREIAAVRRRGYALVRATWIAGVDAAAVPVFDHRGRIALALILVTKAGSGRRLDAKARALCRWGRRLSAPRSASDISGPGRRAAARAPARTSSGDSRG